MNNNKNNRNNYYKKKRITTALRFLLYTFAAVALFYSAYKAGSFTKPLSDYLILPGELWLQALDWNFALMLLGLGGAASGLAIIKFCELLCLFVKSPKYIYLLSIGLALSENKDIEMCEKMALDGYILVSTNRFGFYKFEAMQAEECDYAVDYSGIERKADDFEEYVKIFESGGWNYVCSSVTFHWFKAPTHTTPIYTDNTGLIQKYEKMHEASFLFMLITIFADALTSALIAAFKAPLAFPLLKILGMLIGFSAGLGVVTGFDIVWVFRSVIVIWLSFAALGVVSVFFNMRILKKLKA